MVNALFKKPIGRVDYKKLIGTNGDIIALMYKFLPLAIEQTKTAAIYLKENNKTSLYDIWVFCKKAAKYKQDSSFDQLVKSPNGLIHNGFGDCKSFSLLAFGLMENLGYNPCLRFVSYEEGRETPTHVYAVDIASGKAVDATISKFTELRYYYKKDMNIQGIFGIGRKKTEKKGTAKKIAAAPLRAAFLSLLSLNFRGLATKLDKVISKNPGKAKGLWEKFGGKFDALKSATAKAKGKKPLLGAGKENKPIKGADENIGEAVTLAAVTTLITAALPLLTAVNGMFKSEGLEATGEMSLEASQLSADTAAVTEATELAKDVVTNQVDASGSSDSGSTTGFSPMLLIGAAAAFFLLKKIN